MFCGVTIGDRNISILNFHSLTGVDYKKAKSSNFSSMADFIYEHSASLDFFTCDANEPKIEFFDNRDKGVNAGLIFGKDKVHSLRDAYKVYLRNINGVGQKNQLAHSYIISKKYSRRYDHVYCSGNWGGLSVNYFYTEFLKVTSDHAMVVCDFIFGI